MDQQDGDNTHFFLGLQIFLPRVPEKLDRTPKTPPADPEDQAKVPKVCSTITFQGNSHRRAGAEGGYGEGADSSAMPEGHTDGWGRVGRGGS